MEHLPAGNILRVMGSVEVDQRREIFDEAVAAGAAAGGVNRLQMRRADARIRGQAARDLMPLEAEALGEIKEQVDKDHLREQQRVAGVLHQLRGGRRQSRLERRPRKYAVNR